MSKRFKKSSSRRHCDDETPPDGKNAALVFIAPEVKAQPPPSRIQITGPGGLIPVKRLYQDKTLACRQALRNSRVAAYAPAHKLIQEFAAVHWADVVLAQANRIMMLTPGQSRYVYELARALHDGQRLALFETPFPRFGATTLQLVWAHAGRAPWNVSQIWTCRITCHTLASERGV